MNCGRLRKALWPLAGFRSSCPRGISSRWAAGLHLLLNLIYLFNTGANTSMLQQQGLLLRGCLWVGGVVTLVLMAMFDWVLVSCPRGYLAPDGAAGVLTWVWGIPSQLGFDGPEPNLISPNLAAAYVYRQRCLNYRIVRNPLYSPK